MESSDGETTEQAETISETIRVALRVTGETYREIAAQTGVSVRAISDFLAGRAINSDTLDRLASWLGITAKVPKKLLRKFPKV